MKKEAVWVKACMKCQSTSLINPDAVGLPIKTKKQSMLKTIATIPAVGLPGFGPQLLKIPPYGTISGVYTCAECGWTGPTIEIQVNVKEKKEV